jgi:hypothetical protein
MNPATLTFRHKFDLGVQQCDSDKNVNLTNDNTINRSGNNANRTRASGANAKSKNVNKIKCQ